MDRVSAMCPGDDPHSGGIVTGARDPDAHTADHREHSGVQRRRHDVPAPEALNVVRANGYSRGADQAGGTLVVHLQRPVVAARHIRASVPERHVLRAPPGVEQAPTGRDDACLSARQPEPSARREADIVRLEAGARVPDELRLERPSDVDEGKLRRGAAERDPQQPAVAGEREMPRPLLELHPRDDTRAQDVGHDELRTPGVCDEGVPAVVRACRVARLVEVVEHRDAEDAHLPCRGVRNDVLLTDPLDRTRPWWRSDPANDTSANEIDDRDMRLEIAGDVRQRRRAQRGRHCRRRKDERASVHGITTSANGPRVPAGEPEAPVLVLGVHLAEPRLERRTDLDLGECDLADLLPREAITVAVDLLEEPELPDTDRPAAVDDVDHRDASIEVERYRRAAHEPVEPLLGIDVEDEDAARTKVSDGRVEHALPVRELRQVIDRVVETED